MHNNNFTQQPSFVTPPNQIKVDLFSQQEILQPQQQYYANFTMKEMLESERRMLASQKEQFESERRILTFQKEQHEFQMKQREEQFEIMMAQREGEFNARQGLTLPGPACVVLPFVGSEDNRYELSNQFPQRQHQQQQILANSTQDDFHHKNNIILGKQLKQAALAVQNKYDDALRLLYEVTKTRDDITKMQDDLVIQRAAMEANSEKDKMELEAKRVEIETNARETRLDVPADMDLDQLRDRLVTIKPFRLGRDVALYISTKLSDLDLNVLKPYLNILFPCHHLAPDQIDHIINECRIDDNHEYVLAKLLMLQSLRKDRTSDENTNSAMIKTIVHQNKRDLESNQLYLDCNGQIKSLSSVITACGTNMKQWGTSKDTLLLEFKLVPLGLTFHRHCFLQFFSLLGSLYSLTAVTSTHYGNTTHTHPTDPSIVDSSQPGFFNMNYWPLLIDGSIPQLSSNPRLYFSTPHIANGAWIQFHGPGVTIFDVGGTDFHLTLGVLCPKGKQGSYTSVRKYYQFGQPQVVQDQHTSHYQISIKWD